MPDFEISPADRLTDDPPDAPPDDAEPPAQAIEGAHESLEPRHVHQIVSVRLGASGDSIFVSRTETLLEHEHGPFSSESAHGEFSDEHARALGMARPSAASSAATQDAEERRTGRGRTRRPPGRRDLPPLLDATRGALISFGSKSRLPSHLSRATLEAYLRQERAIALDVRDPVAIAYAAERYTTVMALLDETQDGETVDLMRPVLTVSQAAKVLGYNAKEVRRLLGQGKINGRKVGSEWRIPLRAVL
jgi:excisionase family DNA binding protein